MKCKGINNYRIVVLSVICEEAKEIEPANTEDCEGNINPENICRPIKDVNI